MKGQTVVLSNPVARDRAKRLIDLAPHGSVANIREATRSGEQNAKMWAMLSDVSRAKPDGRCHAPETWKALFMAACGWEVQFVEGLDGRPFPEGFRSSRLTVREMADLITFIQAWGDERGVLWTDERQEAA